MTYSDRSPFETQLGTFIVEDYSAAGYSSGDIVDLPTVDVHSNASVTAVRGEVDYRSTRNFGLNTIGFDSLSGTYFYCAGCNGSFELGFTTTSVGTAAGVFGVGFDPFTAQGIDSVTAFITFGDSSTQNITLPTTGFFGITSDLLIRSIHIGDLDGAATDTLRYAITDLTFGSAATNTSVPEPTSLVLLGVGASLLARRRKNQAV
jgi:hypothetical protein